MIYYYYDNIYTYLFQYHIYIYDIHEFIKFNMKLIFIFNGHRCPYKSTCVVKRKQERITDLLQLT